MNGKIVLCENELIVAMDIKNILHKNGFKIMGVFTSAEPALEFIKADKPDLVISNYKLKGKINGLKLAEILHEKHLTKTLLVTGILMNKHEQEINRLNVNYIKKPFSSEDLLTKIKLSLNI